jgi:hypothetical protein
MGLPASQRRILEEIEETLRDSDPRLTSLFTIFTRLNSDEEMPRIEELCARAALISGRIRFRLAAAGRWLGARPRLRNALIFPMAMAAMAGTLLIGVALPVTSRCGAVPRVAGALLTGAPPRARFMMCSRAVLVPAFLGR